MVSSSHHVTLLLVGGMIALIVLSNFGFTVFAVSNYGFDSEDAKAALNHKSPVAIVAGALAGWVMIRVGETTAGAQRVACGTVDRIELDKLKANAMGPGGRGGVATYKRGAATEFVDYKMHSVVGVTAEVDVDVAGAWYQFVVTCESTCEIFALVAPKPNSQRAAL